MVGHFWAIIWKNGGVEIYFECEGKREVWGMWRAWERNLCEVGSLLSLVRDAEVGR